MASISASGATSTRDGNAASATVPAVCCVMLQYGWPNMVLLQLAHREDVAVHVLHRD